MGQLIREVARTGQLVLGSYGAGQLLREVVRQGKLITELIWHGANVLRDRRGGAINF